MKKPTLAQYSDIAIFLNPFAVASAMTTGVFVTALILSTSEVISTESVHGLLAVLILFAVGGMVLSQSLLLPLWAKYYLFKIEKEYGSVVKQKAINWILNENSVARDEEYDLSQWSDQVNKHGIS